MLPYCDKSIKIDTSHFVLRNISHALFFENYNYFLISRSLVMNRNALDKMLIKDKILIRESFYYSKKNAIEVFT